MKLINLNITTIRFSITAVVSILHRISGFLLFLIIGPILFLLQFSLSSQEKFSIINDFLNKYSVFFKLFLWGAITTLVYHTISGIRHILIDIGYLEQTLSIGNISAKIVFILTMFLSIFVGILVCYL